MMARPQKKIIDLRKDIQRHFNPIAIVDILHLNHSDDLEVIYQKLEAFVGNNVRGITSSQLRKIFDKIFAAETPKAVTMQRPQFAYLIARQLNEDAKRMMLLADELAKNVKTTEEVKDFKDVMEIVVAFHRFYEAIRGGTRAKDKLVDFLKQDLRPTTIRDLVNLEHIQSPQKALKQLEKFIKQNAYGVTSTQLRNIYDRVLHIQESFNTDGDKNRQMQLLRPKLLYLIARENKKGTVKLMLFLIESINELKNQKNGLKAFQKLLEKVVGIHKYLNEDKSEKKSRTEAAVSLPLMDAVETYFAAYDLEDFMDGSTATDFAGMQEKLISFIEKNLGDLNSAQLRKLYEEVQQIDKDKDDAHKKLKLLRPHFLYALGRQRKEGSKKIITLLIFLLEKMEKGQVAGFQQFMEDIVAYHKFAEVTNTKENKTIQA